MMGFARKAVGRVVHAGQASTHHDAVQASSFHTSGSSCVKWARQFESKVYGYTDARQRHSEYLKRQARAAAKRSLRKWRFVDLCESVIERVRSASGSINRETFKGDWRASGSHRSTDSSQGRRQGTSGSGSRSENSESKTEKPSGSRGETHETERPRPEPTVGLVSDRVILGLPPIGPLTVSELKDAFRQCALKWHPDRHEGDSKCVAEVKFKQIGSAYEALLTLLMAT